MEGSSKVIFALNALIEVNDRRSRHYNALADRSKDDQLKKLFQAHAIRSVDFTGSLNKWRVAYGASTYPEKKFSVFSITWNQVKDALMFTERNDMLDQCECIENDALKLYKTAITLSFLPAEALSDIQKQITEFEKACKALKVLKNNSSYVMSRAVA